uniref:Uncharacterized protein n=1 Tax=uncultured bacterium contig00013 TaxID=1181504 RepID=A0A806KJV3_9BACT|nr:hypothetical protein [uncultured bacterium contig00013]
MGALMHQIQKAHFDLPWQERQTFDGSTMVGKKSPIRP